MTAGANIRPDKLPDVPENHLRALIEAYQLDAPVMAIGIRGYAAVSGKGDGAGENLVGVYDDAMCIVTAEKAVTFPGNTDPSRTIEGRAVLEAPQLMWVVPGIHGKTRPAAERRLAFIQDSPVTIRRYDANGKLGDPIAKQWPAINIHDGSWTTTGSAACQTVAPERWREYVATMIRPLDITIEEWDAIEKKVKDGGNVPTSWSKLRIPYLVTI